MLLVPDPMEAVLGQLLLARLRVEGRGCLEVSEEDPLVLYNADSNTTIDCRVLGRLAWRICALLMAPGAADPC